MSSTTVIHNKAKNSKKKLLSISLITFLRLSILSERCTHIWRFCYNQKFPSMLPQKPRTKNLPAAGSKPVPSVFQKKKNFLSVFAQRTSRVIELCARPMSESNIFSPLQPVLSTRQLEALTSLSASCLNTSHHSNILFNCIGEGGGFFFKKKKNVSRGRKRIMMQMNCNRAEFSRECFFWGGRC